MSKILSVIVPTYNMERYLDKCLGSLIINKEMLFQRLEVLVIIDGATDQSSAIAHSYQARYPEVFIVVDKTNGNYGSCINMGLDLATGKYIKVLDADDSFDTKSLEGYLKFLQSVDEDMIISPFVTVDEHGRELQRVSYDLPAEQSLTWKQLTPVFKKRSLQMHAVTYKTQNIRAINYRQTEGISYTDQEWIFTPLTTVNSAITYPHVLYKYLVGRGGQTMNPEVFKRNISHNEQCCRRIIKDYKAFAKFEREKQEYIDYRFLGTIKALYNWYLVRYTDLDIAQLVKYDDFVRSVDETYIDLLNQQTLKYTHYHFIKRWHADRTKRPKMCALYYVYAKIMDKLNNVICRIN